MRLSEKLSLFAAYAKVREESPLVPAQKAWAYVNSDGSQSFAEFMCPGHEWVYSGSAYGGDDESYHGEGRVYCLYCGADGDA